MSSPDKTCAERSLREKGSRKTDDCGGLYERSRAGRTRRLAFAAMFAALALIFSYVEVLVPIPVPIPGVKLGLANLVILIALYRLGFRYAFAINCVRIVIADCMKADLKALTAEAFGENAPFSIVANLPYYITADFLMRAVRLSPERITVMVQKEAAERMLSQPGDKNWCATAATVRYFAEPSMVMEAPASLFTPPPHVDSALLRLEMRETRAVPAEREEAFLNLIQVAFRMRRKTLANNLTAGLSLSRTDALRALEAAGLDERVRGETLTLADFERLAEALHEK